MRNQELSSAHVKRVWNVVHGTDPSHPVVRAAGAQPDC